MAEEGHLGGGRYQEILPRVAGAEGGEGNEEETEREGGRGGDSEVLPWMDGKKALAGVYHTCNVVRELWQPCLPGGYHVYIDEVMFT